MLTCDAIAAAGGTEFTEFQKAENADELTEVLDTIAWIVIGCEYDLGEYDRQEVDLNNVSFLFSGEKVDGKVEYDENCEENEVAPRLVANADDLEQIAADDNADVPALRGWRRELFGEAALALKHGRLALTAADRSVRVIDVAGS